MVLDDKEKGIARNIVADKDMCALLAKVFTTQEESLNRELITSKTNEELGEIVRANALAEQKVLTRWSNLLRVGTPENAKQASSVVPD